MAESFLIGGIIASILLAAVFIRIGQVEQELRALSRLDAKLDALLEHAGIRFDPYEGVPAAVMDALARGKKIEAIKHYRAAKGVGLKEAKEFVEELQRRGRTQA